MDETIRGRSCNLAVLDGLSEEMINQDFVDLEERVVETPSASVRDGITVLYVAYLIRSHLAEPEPWAYVVREHEPLPRPPRVPVKIKQAPRQSFRRVMRSVNRNR